ncbi:MAG TPA: hypothetical protein DIC19_01620 [Erysipelotrichaceae bacterium]|nr:hypothetical protein [Erysipelotrichaceae bacterium]
MPNIETLRQIASLNQNAKQIINRNPQEALALANEALNLALEAQDPTSICSSHYFVGSSKWRLGQLTDAITSLQEADIINKYLDQPVHEVEILNTLGNIYLDLQIYDLAFTYYQMGYHAAQHQNDPKMIATLLSNVGEIYRELNDYEAALDHYQLSLDGLKNLDQKERIIYPISNIGAVYLAQDKLDLAQEYTMQALELARFYDDRIIESLSLKFLGILAKKNFNYSLAEDYLNQSLTLYSETQELLFSTDVLFELHDLYTEQNKIQQALIYLNEAIMIGEDLKANHILKQAYQRLVKDHQALNNTQNAFFFMEKYMEVSEEIEKDKLDQKLRSIQLMKQADITAQERDDYFLLNQQLEKAYQSAEVIHAIGRKVTATNDLEALYNIVYENLSILMSSTTFGIAIHSENLKALQYQYLIVDEERMENHFASLENKNSLAVQCFIQNRSLVFRTRDDIKNVLHQTPSSTIGSVMNSMMFVPLVIEDKAIGIITIQNRADHAYNEQSLKTLETLAAYIAIAIRNTQKNNALKAQIEEKSSIQNELAKLNKELQDLSEIDGLTGIANRRHFDEFYEYEFKRCLRSNEWISLMMLDIDHFKEYNDHYGHLQGDEIIILIAKLIAKHAKRSSDLAVRFGGDEFIVVLSNTPLEDAHRIALVIQKEISELTLLHEHSPIASTISLSIGIASLIPSTECSTNALLEKADQALYKAKGNGRNQIQIYKEST